MGINLSGGINVNVNAGIDINAGLNIGVTAGLNAGASLSLSTPGSRKDPYIAYSFRIEIDGITAGGFSEISGLGIQTDVERKTFGGENSMEYKFIKGTKYNDLTLKHGLIDLDLLWNWYQEIINGKVSWKNGTIYVRDQSLKEVEGWHFLNACPIKWDGPTFNASSSAIATETLVLTYHKLIRHGSGGINITLPSLDVNFGIGIGIG